MLKLDGSQLPYGKPLDWDELTFKQQWAIAEHQFRTKVWADRVANKKMTQRSNEG